MPTLSLKYSIDDSGGGFKKLSIDAKEFAKIIREGTKAAHTLGKEIGKYASMTVVFNAVKDAVSELNSVVQDLSAAYQIQAQVETQLATVMRERMGATDKDIQAKKATIVRSKHNFFITYNQLNMSETMISGRGREGRPFWRRSRPWRDCRCFRGAYGVLRGWA